MFYLGILKTFYIFAQLFNYKFLWNFIMNKILMLLSAMMLCMASYAEESVSVNDSVISHDLNEVTVTSFYRTATTLGSVVDFNSLIKADYGQELSWLFAKMPSIFAFSDNGTDFGYGYFRIRGLDQTRINVTLDGMPWNEGEDFGCYFANSPDIMADASSISVGRGSSTYNPGTSNYGGSVNIESTNLLTDNTSYVDFGGGSFNTYKSSVCFNSGLIGKWAFHVRATSSQTDGYREHSSNNSKSIGLKVGYFMNAKSSIDFLSITGFHRNGQGYIGSTLDELSVNRKDNGCSELEDDNFLQTVNKLQYNSWLNDRILFTSSIYWNMLIGAYRFDLDNYLYKICGDSETKTDMLYNYGLKHHMYGGNAAARYYFDKGNVTFGTNIYKFEREHYLDDRNIDKARNIPIEEYYDNRGHKFDFELFANLKKEFGKLSVSANAQYRHVNFWYCDLMNPSIDFNENTKWNFLNLGVNLEYKFDSHNELYLKYARSHREPTRTDMFGGNEWYDAECGLTTTDAEISNDFELGWNVATKNLNMNINLFAMLFEDERALTGTIGMNGLPEHEKADNSHRIGMEFYADYEPINGLHFINNSSLSNNKVRTNTFGKKSHVMTPSCTFRQNAEYRGKKYSLGLEYSYRSHLYIDAANEFRVPDNWQFNMYGSYSIGKYVLSGHVNNITNRNNLQTGILTNTNEPRYMVDIPTSFHISVKYIF